MIGILDFRRKKLAERFPPSLVFTKGFAGVYKLSIWPTNSFSPLNHLNRNSPVSKDAVLEFNAAGSLTLVDGGATVWTSNTSDARVETADMSDTGNLLLLTENNTVAWQSFSHPSDTLLPGQPLTVSMELISSVSPSRGGYYTLKMLQQPTSLSLALTYNVPETYDSSPEFYSNYSYWSGPDISNVTGDVIAVLDGKGSFGIVYGSSSDGAVYVHKNDGDINGGLSSAANQSVRPSILRRLILETNGNLRLYRWDNDVNGSSQWVSEWAAVSNPCDIGGICGNGICTLDRTKTNASCRCLPGSNAEAGTDVQCYGNSSLTGKCDRRHENLTNQFKIETVQFTNYYFSERSVIANYSDTQSVSKCGNACLSDCECIASVSGLSDEKPYCWLLSSLEFGGFEDPGATMFVKVESNGSFPGTNSTRKSRDSSDKSSHDKVLVLPIVLSMTLLIGLLCCLLYVNIHRKRSLKRTLESSLILSGAPMSFTFRDLQCRTNNFSHLLGTGKMTVYNKSSIIYINNKYTVLLCQLDGTNLSIYNLTYGFMLAGGFGSVFRGSLGDGTLIAVKKLDKVLPHGEKEFITEVNTIGSMHHMNLVRLCGYCSEGTRRLVNGSLEIQPDHVRRV